MLVVDVVVDVSVSVSTVNNTVLVTVAVIIVVVVDTDTIIIIIIIARNPLLLKSNEHVRLLSRSLFISSMRSVAAGNTQLPLQKNKILI